MVGTQVVRTGIPELLFSIGTGLPVTLAVALGSWLLACTLGLGLDLLRRGRLLRSVVGVVIVVLRGVPELLAVFILFYGLANHVRLGAFTAAITALGIKQASFTAEIFKASFRTVPRSQREAGTSLGLARFQILRLIVLPQAFRFALVPLLNVLVGLTKGASIMAAIGVPEVIYRARTIMALDLAVFPATLAMCLLYLGLTLPMTRGVRALEAWLRGSRALG